MNTSSQKWFQSGTLFWTEVEAGRQRKTYSQKSFHSGKHGGIIKAQGSKALLKLCLNPSFAKATQHHFPQWRLNSKTPDCQPQLHGKVVMWTAANRAALRKVACYGQGQSCIVHASLSSPVWIVPSQQDSSSHHQRETKRIYWIHDDFFHHWGNALRLLLLWVIRFKVLSRSATYKCSCYKNATFPYSWVHTHELPPQNNGHHESHTAL